MEIKHNQEKFKLIVLEDGKEIGYLKYDFPNDASNEKGNRNVEIEYIHVSPDYRGKGIASNLMDYFLEQMKDVVWISLWTGREAETDETYGLYEKFGFTQEFVQDDYYEDGIPTRLFVRRMKTS